MNNIQLYSNDLCIIFIRYYKGDSLELYNMCQDRLSIGI